MEMSNNFEFGRFTNWQVMSVSATSRITLVTRLCRQRECEQVLDIRLQVSNGTDDSIMTIGFMKTGKLSGGKKIVTFMNNSLDALFDRAYDYIDKLNK